MRRTKRNELYFGAPNHKTCYFALSISPSLQSISTDLCLSAHGRKPRSYAQKDPAVMPSSGNAPAPLQTAEHLLITQTYLLSLVPLTVAWQTLNSLVIMCTQCSSDSSRRTSRIENKKGKNPRRTGEADKTRGEKKD